MQLQAKKKDRFADRPFLQHSFLNASFRSEQILFDKNIEVKPYTPRELAAKRREVANSREESASNVAAMQKHRKSVLPTPPLLQPKGFLSYVRRLERAERLLDVDATKRSARAETEVQPLGNNTESRAGFQWFLDEKTGEYQRHSIDFKRNEYVLDIPAEFAIINARSARFSAQSSAGKLLAKEATPRGTQWRVTGCVRRKIGAEVGVMYSSVAKKAHFGGLMVCGSVWTCPPCAAKVSERRKLEVVQATDMHKSQGGGLYMITTTTSHKRTDNLQDWLLRFSDARARMRRQRGYRELLATLGYVGNIRALEVTYGDSNGWHPHEHGLWLLAKPLTSRQLTWMRSKLFELWRDACRAAGLPLPNRKAGVNIVLAESAAEYIAKFGREPRWGVGSEMAKQHSKQGKIASLTPFDLLRRYHDGSDDGSHKRFGALFVVFAKAFFGKRQIVWSDGLKQVFGIASASDEDIAVEEADDAVELVRISASQWRCVLHQRSDVRQVVLERAESGGHDAVVAYLDSLMSAPGYVPF